MEAFRGKCKILNFSTRLTNYVEAIVKCEDGFVALSEIIQKFKLEKRQSQRFRANGEFVLQYQRNLPER